MSPKLAALALADLALAIVVLVATESTIGTVIGLVLLAAGVVVAGIAIVRRPVPSAEEGLRRAVADAEREQATSKTIKDRTEDGGFLTGGQ